SNRTLDSCYTTTTNTTLSGSFGGCNLNGQVGHWSIVTYTGTNAPVIVSPNSNNTSVTNLKEGTYVFRWDVTGPCASGSAQVTITVPHALGTATPASTQGIGPFCDGRTSFTLIGNNPLKANETGTWSQNSGPNTATINSPNTPITTVTVPANSIGVYSFNYMITDTLTHCNTSSNTSVGFYAPPSITLDPDIALPCGDSTATVNYTATGGSTITWQIISGPTNNTYPVIPTPLYPATTSPQMIYNLGKVGTYTIRFRVTPGVGASCETATADVNITTSQLPTSSNSGTPQLLACNVYATHLAGNYPFAGTGWWTENTHPMVEDTLNPGTYFEYPANFQDHTLNTTLIDSLHPGVYRLTWRISNGDACDPSFDPTRVIVADFLPSYVYAGPDRDICYGTTIRMQADPPALNEIGHWTVTPSGPVFANASNPKTKVSNLGINTLYSFIWTLHNNCGTISDTALIHTTFDPGPVDANAGPDQCQPASTTTITLQGNDPGPGTGTWRQIPDPTPPVTITNPGDSATTVTGMTPGTYQFEWSIARGVCEATIDTVTITIADPVTSANAGPDREICGDHSKMAANAPVNTGEVGTWTVPAGEEGIVIIDNIHADTTNVGIVTTGAYQLIWTISNGACISSSDTVVLRVSIPPSTANAGVDRTLCAKDTLNLAATPITSGTALWSLVSGPNSPTFSSLSNPHAHLSGLITGTYVFKWTVTGGPHCPPSSDEVTMIVYANANAGADQTFCDASTIELTGNVGSAGVWTLVSGPSTPTITPTVPASNKSTASPLFTGTYTFRYTLTYPGCSSYDDVDIIVSGQPTTANAGSEQFLCKLSTPYTISLYGNAPDPGHGTGTWSRLWPVSDGGSFSDVHDPLAAYSPATPQLYIFEWTIADGTCSSSSNVRVTLDAPPTPSNAGANQQVCGTQTTMGANAPTAGSGRWSQVSGPGTAVFSSYVLPTPTVTGLVTGSYMFRWTIKNGPVCDSSSSTVVLNVHANPGTPYAGPDQDFCASTLTATLAGNTPTPGTSVWYQSTADPISGVSFSPSASTPHAVATFPGAGTYHLIWMATNTYSGGSCILRDTVVITIDQFPSVAYAGEDMLKCQFSTLSLNAATPTVGIGTWTVNSQPLGSGPVLFANPNSPATQVFGTGAGTYDFDWTVANGQCPSNTDQVEVTILDYTPIAIAGPNQGICNSTSTYMEGNSPGAAPNSGTWTQVAGVAGGPVTITFVDPHNPDTQVTGISVQGIYKVVWSISNGACSTSDTIKITKYPDVTATCPVDATICTGGTQTLTVTPSGGAGPGSYTYQWESNTTNTWPGTVIAGATNASYTTPALTSGMYYRVTVQCGNITCVAHVSVVPDPVITSQPSGSVICSGSTAGLSVTASGGTPGILYQWFSGTTCGSAIDEISGATSSSYTTPALTQTMYYRAKVWSSGNGCATVYSDCAMAGVPRIITEPSDALICNSGSYTMSVVTDSGGATLAYQWQEYNGTIYVNVGGATSSTYTAAGLTNGIYKYKCIISISPGSCPNLVTREVTVNAATDPVINSGTTAQTICSGGSATFAVSVSGGTGHFTYQWQHSTSCGGPWTNISGATTTSYNTGAVGIAGTYYYQCVVTQLGTGCTPQYSDCYSLTVTDGPSVGVVPALSTICSGDTRLLTSSVTGGSGTNSYQWQTSTSGCGGGWSDINGATSQDYTTPALTQTTYYHVVVTQTGHGCGPVISNCATVGVPRITTQPVDGLICNSGTYVMTVGTDAGGATLAYQWQEFNGSIYEPISAATNASYTATGLTTGIYKYKCGIHIVPGPCPDLVTREVTVNSASDPEITTVPAAQTICTGGSATFAVSVSGGTGTFLFQWQTGGSCSGPWSDIPGASNISYNTGAMGSTGTYYYQCTVTQTGTGCTPQTSGCMTLTVTDGPSVELAPSISTICSGETNLLEVSVYGGSGAITCRWQSNTSGCSGAWADINGATSQSYVTPALTQTTYYHVIITQSGNGCGPVTSNCARVYVPRITTQPSGITLCEGSSHTMSVTVDGGGSTLAYQWQEKISGTYVDIFGATDHSYITPALASGDYYYHCNITITSPPCTMLTTDEVHVTVVGIPQVTLGPGDQVICSGGNAIYTVSVTGGTGTTSYQWQSGTGTNCGDVTWGNIGGATATTYNTGTMNSPGTRYYRCVVTQSVAGCDPVYLVPCLKLVISPDPVITSQPASSTICNGGQQTLSVTVTGGTTGTAYQWQSNTINCAANFNDISGATSSTYTTNQLAISTYFKVKITQEGSSCGAISNCAKVTVLADPISPNPQSATICDGGTHTMTVSPTGGTGTFTYQWEDSPDHLVFTPIGGATNSSYTTPALTTTKYYRAVISQSGIGCGPLTTGYATVTVVADPVILVDPAGSDICTGGTPTMTVTASGGAPSLTYQWQRSSTGGAPWTNVGSNSSTYTSSPLSSITYFRVIVSAAGSGCASATSATATINVYPDPSILVQPVGATICSGNTYALSVTATGDLFPGTLLYKWQSNTTGCSGSWADISGATSQNYTTPALTQTTYYHVVLTQALVGCGPVISDCAPVVVPKFITQPAGANLCENGTHTMSVSFSGGSATLAYQWQTSPISGSGYSDISGATMATYTTPSLAIGDHYYHCNVLVTTPNCGTYTSDEALVHVVGQANVTIGPANQFVCVGGSASFNVSVTGGAGITTYQWQRGTGADCASVSNWTNISGATGTTYNTGTLTLPGTTYYKCIVSQSQPGCSPIYNLTCLKLEVAGVAITAQPTPSSICTGGTANLSVTVTGATSGTTYQWQSTTLGCASSFSDISGATTATY
ncbi:MAG: hypothetical protein WCK34_09820, partial [Bacteroidota bacterium]